VLLASLLTSSLNTCSTTNPHQVEEPAVCSYVLRATHPLACDEQGADRRL
jgi:hypothetical protein